MTLGSALLSLGVAVVAGALVGAEREQAHIGKPVADFGGVRTFPLLALLGGIAGLLAPVLGSFVVAVFLGAAIVFLAIAQLRTQGNGVGVTSEVAAVVTFGLGVIAASPELLPDGTRFLLVFGVAGVTMALLALKRPLHGFIARVSDDDVLATVKFVLLAVVVIPLLPDRTFGPFAVLNPRKIGLMIALVAAVGFAGYVVARVVGSRRGLLVTGLIGGLVSSTAVTLALSARAKAQPELSKLCAVAITAACATMFARMIVIVGVVAPSLLLSVAPPLGAMALGGSIIAWRTYASIGVQSGESVSFHNPFELKRAIQFGLLYGVILLAVKGAEHYVGTSGLYVSVALASLADVDAITLSLAELHSTGLAGAGIGITLAAFVNTLSKGGLAVALGGRELGKGVLRALFGMLLAGGIALLLVSLFARS